MRVLSGIQPSGALHIGNYMGAIRQYIDLQRGNDAFYFVADYHALTSVRDAGEAARVRLRRDRGPAGAGARPRGRHAVRPVRRARDDRAGLAPDQRHADGLAGEVRQLQGQGPARPARRARPVRLPRAPGGRHPPVRRRRRPRRPGPEAAPGDHPRHRRAVQPRLRRDLQAAQAVHPRHRRASSPASTAGRCPRATTNTIEIFDDPRSILKKCKKIVTDSTPVEAPKDPDRDNLFQLFKLFAPPDQVAEVEGRYRSGGIGYGEVKTRLAEHIAARFAEPRERRAELVANPAKVQEIRRAAAEKAKRAARIVLDRAHAACGVS